MTAPVRIEEDIRATYANRVSRALSLIKPKAELRDDCGEVVTTALIEIEFIVEQDRATSRPRTKEAKKAAGRLASALERIEVVLKDRSLDFYIKMFFPKAELLKWKLKCQELAKTTSGKLVRTNAYKKRLAVGDAYRLMTSYGGRAVATKDSNFCRLAALLYGDPKADLHNQCRSFLREKRGQK